MFFGTFLFLVSNDDIKIFLTLVAEKTLGGLESGHFFAACQLNGNLHFPLHLSFCFSLSFSVSVLLFCVSVNVLQSNFFIFTIYPSISIFPFFSICTARYPFITSFLVGERRKCSNAKNEIVTKPLRPI